MPKGNPELAVEMGKRMAARRKMLSMTQEKVADLAGIVHQQYNKAEKGKTCVGSDTLLRISIALRTSADYLLTGEEPVNRYQELLPCLDEMSDAQLRLAQEILQRVLQFGEQSDAK